jgi:hypothetical protein
MLIGMRNILLLETVPDFLGPALLGAEKAAHHSCEFFSVAGSFFGMRGLVPNGVLCRTHQFPNIVDFYAENIANPKTNVKYFRFE